MTAMSTEDSNEWFNNMRKISMSLASKFIPEVGWLVSLVINLFWPVQSVSVWDQVKKQVKNLVDNEIFNKEYRDKKLDLDALGKGLKEYKTYKTFERGAKLTSLRTEITRLYYEMKGSPNKIHFIAFLITLAYMDMALLQDRYYNGKSMFKDDNSKIWKAEFYKQCYEYTTTITNIYPSWIEWRRNKIDVSTNWSSGFTESHNYVDVIDYANNNRKFTQRWDTPWQIINFGNRASRYPQDYLRVYYGNLKKLEWANEAIAKFHYLVLSAVYNLPKFLPEYKDEKGFVLCGNVNSAIVSYGPYYDKPQACSYSDSNRIHFTFPYGKGEMTTFVKDKLQYLTLWTKGTQITGMRTDWEISGDGMLFGVASGAKEHLIKVTGNYVYRMESWIDYQWNSSVGGPKICSLRSQKFYFKGNIPDTYIGEQPDKDLSKRFDSKDIFINDDYQMYVVSPGVDGSYRGGFDQVFNYFTPYCTAQWVYKPEK
eukprot:456064_1